MKHTRPLPLLQSNLFQRPVSLVNTSLSDTPHWQEFSNYKHHCNNRNFQRKHPCHLWPYPPFVFPSSAQSWQAIQHWRKIRHNILGSRSINTIAMNLESWKTRSASHWVWAACTGLQIRTFQDRQKCRINCTLLRHPFLQLFQRIYACS